MIALIDGDVLVYRAAASVQQNYYLLKCGGEQLRFRYKSDLNGYVEDLEEGSYEIESGVNVGSFDNVKEYIDELMFKIQEVTGSDDYKIFLGGVGNYREEIATIKPYKGQRDSGNRPHFYEQTRDYLIYDWDASVVNGMEADDALGIWQSDETVICTIDKDLDMVPGMHYNFVTDNHYWVHEDEALSNFYHQLLIGDSVDNIRGAVGIGKVKAKKLLEGLQTEKELYKSCLKAYKDKRDELIENARLLWIKQEVDEPLWEPPVLETIKEEKKVI